MLTISPSENKHKIIYRSNIETENLLGNFHSKCSVLCCVLCRVVACVKVVFDFIAQFVREFVEADCARMRYSRYTALEPHVFN